MKYISLQSGFIVALFLLSPGLLFAQNKMPVDSIPYYMKAFESKDSTCPGKRSDIPNCWFEVRNTALGVVIYAVENRPFTIQFVDSNRLVEWNGPERSLRRIDSVYVGTNVIKVFCRTRETWGTWIVKYEFTELDPVSKITHLKKTDIMVVRTAGSAGTAEKSEEKWVIPYSANGDYFILTEPNRKSPESRIPFLPMDKSRLKLYK